MAIKTFTTGEVLTSANTNTYLANAGLVYITEVTASATPTSANVAGCFSSTYENYRVEITNLFASTTANIGFQMLSGTTPLTTASYSWGYTGISTLGASTNTFSNSGVRGSILDSYGAVVNGVASFDVMKPFLAAQTAWIGASSAINGGLNGYDMKTGIVLVENTVSYDGFRLIAAAGNISFRVKVYGYRQA